MGVSRPFGGSFHDDMGFSQLSLHRFFTVAVVVQVGTKLRYGRCQAYFVEPMYAGRGIVPTGP